MRFFQSLFVLFLVCVLTTPVARAWSFRSCKVQAFRLAKSLLLPNSKVKLSAEEKLLLEELRRSQLSVEQSWHSIPTSLSFRGEDYQVVERLGDGDEGIVYRVRKDNQDYSLKILLSSDARPIEDMKKLEDLGTPAIKVLGVEQLGGEMKVLQSYVHGFSVRDLLFSGDLRGDLKPRIKEAFAAWKLLYCPVITLCAAKNVALDFRTGKFVAIDAH